MGKKLKLKRKFGGKTYEFVGSRGSKRVADKFAKHARNRGKSVRVVQRGKGAASWHIFERKGK